MKPYRDKRNLAGFLLLIFLLSSLIFPPQSLVKAQTPSPPPTETPSPTPTPTPTPAPPPIELHLTASQTPDPLVGGDSGEIDFTLSAERAPDALCYGIPLDPLDLFFVVDNSLSAGQGPGSNLDLTIRWLNAFLTSIERQPPAGDPPQRSRIGLAASHTITTGTELLWQRLTENYEDLYQLLDELSSGGDTELATSIRRAVTALQQRARPQARQVLVLMLHDRMPLTEAVREEIARARQSGIDVYLIANSLNLEDDEVIDTELVSSLVDQDHFLFDPSIEELRRAFVRMTGGSPDALAQNIALTLLATPEGFRDLEVSPPGVVITDTVSWLVPQLTEGEEVELTYRGIVGNQENFIVQATYQDCNGDLRTQIFNFPFTTVPGSHTPTPAATATEAPPSASSSETPPTSPPTEEPEATLPAPPDIPEPELPSLNPQGPIVWLVELIPGLAETLAPLFGALPVILQWILLLLFIALLLFLLWRLIQMLKKWLQRRKKTVPPPPPPPRKPVQPPPPPPQAPPIPQWIRKLPDTAVSAPAGDSEVATKTPHPLQDTLIIGIGEAGREVLGQVADGLHARFGQTWPENIRLLQVDVEPKGEELHLSPPRGLRSDQQVILTPDFQEIEEALRSDRWAFAHRRWYQAASGRARGRMAIFDDVKNGSKQSTLWEGLTRALDGLTSPVVRIVGTTFDDISSGMLVDLARLVQLAITGDTDGNADIQLWLAGPVGRPWSKRLNGGGKIRPEDQQARTLATLRELERFQRNAPVRFRYVPDTNQQDLFRALRTHALLNKIILFEPESTLSAPPEDDVLACMADTLLAFVNSEASRQWDGHLAGTNPAMGTLANEYGKGAALAIGSYALRYPKHLLAEAMAWRMVREVLFEQAIGIQPMERLEMADGSYQTLSAPPGPSPISDNGSLDTLVQSKDLKHAVRKQLNEYLNGEAEAGESLLRRRTGLMQAIKWLKRLRGTLLQYDKADAAQQVRKLEKELAAWQQWLREEVYPLCTQAFEDARAELERLRRQTARHWGIDASLEWELYRKLIRSWTDKPKGSTQDERLLRLAARFGWEVAIDEERKAWWRPRLIVPPGEFNEELEARTLERLNPYEVSRNDPESFLQKLFEIALRLSQWNAQTSLLEAAEKEDPAEWLERAQVRLKYNESLASREMHQVEHLTLLVAPESADHTSKLEKRLRDVPDRRGSLKLCQTSDPTSVTVVRATSWLPLYTLALYAAKAWESSTVFPEMYVWRAEQIAAKMESRLKKQRRISALLRSFIAANPELMQAFGLAFIYGKIQQSTYGWSVPGMDERYASIAAAIEAVFEVKGDQQEIQQVQETRIKVLRTEVEKRRQEIKELRSYLRKVEKERLTLLESQEASTYETILARDFAIYVRGLIAEERNTAGGRG